MSTIRMNTAITATEQKRFVNCEQQWTGCKLVSCKHTTNCIHALIYFSLSLSLTLCFQFRFIYSAEMRCVRNHKTTYWLSTWKYGVHWMCVRWSVVIWTIRLVELTQAASDFLGSVELWKCCGFLVWSFVMKSFSFMNFHFSWNLRHKLQKARYCSSLNIKHTVQLYDKEVFSDFFFFNKCVFIALDFAHIWNRNATNVAFKREFTAFEVQYTIRFS